VAVWPSAPTKTTVAKSCPLDTVKCSQTGMTNVQFSIAGSQLSEDLVKGCSNFHDQELVALDNEYHLSDPNYPSQYFTSITPTEEITSNDIAASSDEIPQYTDLQPLGAPVVDVENNKLVLQPEDLVLTTPDQSQVDSILSKIPNFCKIFYINDEIKLDGSKVITLDNILVPDQLTNFCPSTSVSPVQQVPGTHHVTSPVHESQHTLKLLHVPEILSSEHTAPYSPQNVTSPIHESRYATSPSHFTQYSAQSEQDYNIPEGSLLPTQEVYSIPQIALPYIPENLNYGVAPPWNAKENIDPGDTFMQHSTTSTSPYLPQNCLYDAVPLKCAKENVDPGDNTNCINITTENLVKTGILITAVQEELEVPSIHLDESSSGESASAFDEFFGQLLDIPAADGDSVVGSSESNDQSTTNKRRRTSESDSGYKSDNSNSSKGSRNENAEINDTDEYTEEQLPVKKRRKRVSKPQSQEKKDDIRKRNNVASRVYRSKKKSKLQVMESELIELKEKNAELVAKADTAEIQVQTMKKLVYQLYNVGGKK